MDDHDAGDQRSRLWKVGTSVFLNYLLSNLGYYTLLPVLPLLLRELNGREAAWSVGAALFTLAFSVRASCCLLGTFLRRVPFRLTMSGGLLTAASGFTALAVWRTPAATIGFLAVAGVGISVNTFMARAYVAVALPQARTRNAAFSAVQVAVNIAAAIGPVAANLLFDGGRYRLCMFLVALIYVVAAAVVAGAIPAGLRATDASGTPAAGEPGVARAVSDLAADPHGRRLMMLSVAGWFLYGQLFSALTLHIGSLTTAPVLRSVFFTVNAVLVVAVQIPVSAHAGRRLDLGTPPSRFLLVGVGLFGLAFGCMAGVGASLAGTFAAIALFSVAETFFTPFVATAFAELSAGSVVAAFTALQIVMAAGESLGALSGGAVYSLLSEHRMARWYWVSLSLSAALVVTAFLTSSAGRSRGAEPDPASLPPEEPIVLWGLPGFRPDPACGGRPRPAYAVLTRSR